MVQEHILASIGAVGPIKPLHRAIPKSAFVDRRRTSCAGKCITRCQRGGANTWRSWPSAIRSRFEHWWFRKAVFPGFGQGVGEDEPRRAPTLALVGRMGTPNLGPIAQVEGTTAVDVVVEDNPTSRPSGARRFPSLAEGQCRANRLQRRAKKRTQNADEF